MKNDIFHWKKSNKIRSPEIYKNKVVTIQNKFILLYFYFPHYLSLFPFHFSLSLSLRELWPNLCNVFPTSSLSSLSLSFPIWQNMSVLSYFASFAFYNITDRILIPFHSPSLFLQAYPLSFSRSLFLTCTHNLTQIHILILKFKKGMNSRISQKTRP